MRKLRQIREIFRILRKDPYVKLEKPVRTRLKNEETFIFVYALVGLASDLVEIFTLGKYCCEWRAIILCADLETAEDID